MKKIIFIRYSELTLKGKNRNEFAKILFSNIKSKLDGLDFEIIRHYDFIEVIPEKDIFEEFLERLRYVIGISWFTIAYKIESSKEYIKKFIIDNIPLNGSFRVSAKNRSNLFNSSEELTKWIASIILQNKEMKVNLSDYDYDVKIKVSEKETLIYWSKYNGIEGLPVGSNGNALVFLSGGIDSPVAAFEMMTRGIKVNFITFLNSVTSTKEVLYKIESLARQISKYSTNKNKLYIVNFEDVQQTIADNLKFKEYRTIFLRRGFTIYSEWLSKILNFNLLITGDALGQVASQTIENMTAVDMATNLLVARPLIGRTKNKIIEIAKEIGTYDYSILSGEDMCLNFAPKKPILKARLDKIEFLSRETEVYEKYFEEIHENKTKIIEIKNN